jgi:hypothetical protein
MLMQASDLLFNRRRGISCLLLSLGRLSRIGDAERILIKGNEAVKKKAMKRESEVTPHCRN